MTLVKNMALLFCTLSACIFGAALSGAENIIKKPCGLVSLDKKDKCFDKLSTSATGDATQKDLSFQVSAGASSYKPVNIQALCVGQNKDLEALANIVKFDLDFTDQLLVDIKRIDKIPNEKNVKEFAKYKKTIEKLFNDETSLCMYFRLAVPKQDKLKKFVNITIKDTSSDESVFDRTFSYADASLIFDAHSISQAIIPVLTGQDGICLSSFAFCKQLSSKKKVICITDYMCKKEKIIVPHCGINVAPRWHSQAGYLFYSQFLRASCQLVSLNIKNKTEKIICSYDGLNMQPSFSPDGIQVALCMSGGGENSELYLYDQRVCKQLKKRVFKQITKNKGNNSSPCLLPNGDIVFCSDFQTGSPQLYYYRKLDGRTVRLSSGVGYSAAPSYSEANNAIAYTRLVNKTFQLFTMSFTEHGVVEKQCTFGSGDKLDATWSPCGRYIAFTYDHKNEKTNKMIPQIGVLNCRSGNIRVLTHSKFPKSFPCWSANPYFQL
ncbi:MAG: hypothetical protein ABH827_00380 [bacterium]